MINIAVLLSILTLDPPFTDHAVLQRDKPVVVRGSADAGAAVAVSFAGKTVKGVADAAGRWSVMRRRGSGTNDTESNLLLPFVYFAFNDIVLDL